jgi:hypothetical protein
MTVFRIVIGIIVTILLLGVAKRISTRRPRELAAELGNLRIEHISVTEQVVPGGPAVSAMIVSDELIEPSVLYTVVGEEGTRRANMIHTGEGRWEAYLPAVEKGGSVLYALTIRREDGGMVRLPEEEGSFLLVKYKGKVSPLVLVLHIIFMFGAFYFMIQSLWSAIDILSTGTGKSSAVSNSRWVLVCAFIGGWPIGFLLNFQAFGPVWEGFPFGYDITDNKTQLIFFFWLVSLLLVRGSFLGKGEDKDMLGPRGFALAVLLSYIVSLFLFIVPHSL